MDFVPALTIARDKAASDAERAALDDTIAVAQRLDDAEAGFARAMAEHRAKRGARPEKPGKSVKRSLDRFAADEAELNAKLLREFAALPDAGAVVRSLHMALGPSVASAERMLGYCPPDDRPVAAARVECMRALKDALSGTIARCGWS